MTDEPRLRRYVSDEATMRSLDTWMVSRFARPDIFIVAPPVRDVGEQELIQELNRASYELSGRRDAKRRHFLSRAFPVNGTPDEYHRFLDEAFMTSEITDEFYGVDNIDLTAWVSRAGNFDEHDVRIWSFLIEHICAHPETDFVFCAFTDDAAAAQVLERKIETDTGVTLEPVTLGYPAPDNLAAAFHDASYGEFRVTGARVRAWFEERSAQGRHMNYAFARSCAGYALHRLSVTDDHEAALDEAFERYRDAASPAVRTRFFGFE